MLLGIGSKAPAVFVFILITGWLIHVPDAGIILRLLISGPGAKLGAGEPCEANHEQRLWEINHQAIADGSISFSVPAARQPAGFSRPLR